MTASREPRQILQHIELAEARVRSSSRSLRGELRVNAPHSFGSLVLSPLLPRFSRRHPELALTLSLDNRVVDMVRGGFDLSIRIRAELPDSGLLVRKLATVHQQLFASAAYIRQYGAPRSPRDLAQHATLVYLHADSVHSWELHGRNKVQQVAFKPRFKLGSSVILRDMLIAGAGVGALPDFIAQAAERTGSLVRVLPDWELPVRHVYAVTASRLGADAKALAFVDHVLEALDNSR